MNKTRKLLIYGDSNTYGYDPANEADGRYPSHIRWTHILHENLRSWIIVPEGRNGRRISDTRSEMPAIKRRCKYLDADDITAVMLGTNDIVLPPRPETDKAIRKMEKFLQQGKLLRKAESILVIAPPHIGKAGSVKDKDRNYDLFHEESRKMNAGLRRVANEAGVMFLDAAEWNIPLSQDRIHFSAEGHAVFAEKMSEFLCSI